MGNVYDGPYGGVHNRLRGGASGDVVIAMEEPGIETYSDDGSEVNFYVHNALDYEANLISSGAWQ